MLFGKRIIEITQLWEPYEIILNIVGGKSI